MAFFKNKIVQIIIACLIPFLGGIIISLTTMGEKEPWYSTIKRPTWNPPDWVNNNQKCLTIKLNFFFSSQDFRSSLVFFVHLHGIRKFSCLRRRRWIFRTRQISNNSLHHSPYCESNMDASVLLLSRNWSFYCSHFNLMGSHHLQCPLLLPY